MGEKQAGESIEVSFASLIISLSSSAWIGLGKIADPISGEVKRDLEGARSTIEIMLMLREKTKGNLAKDEERLLNGVIADLQANYAESVFAEKQEGGGGDAGGAEAPRSDAAGADGPKADSPQTGKTD